MARSVVDPTLRNLAGLDPQVQELALDLVNLARSVGIPLIVTSGMRTPMQQAQLVRQGRSRTLQSRHLTGRAFDVDLYGIHRDNVSDRVWNWLGPRAEAFGLTWGGRWQSFRDLGHFEF